MSKRNFILLAIILVIVVIAVFGFLYSRPDTTTGGEGGGTNFISRFNPFGSGKTPPPPGTPPVDVSPYEPSPDEETSKVKLIKVSSMPIAGFTVFMKERLKDVPIVIPSATPLTDNAFQITPTAPSTEFVPALRYVEKATGNIYQTFVDKIEERKFSGTTILKVYEAYFGNNGESVIMRYLKADARTIETFVGVLPKEYLGADSTGTNEVKGYFLPNNVKDISVSLDTLKVFYLVNNGNNVVGTTLNLLDNKKVQVFDSPFTEWLSQWPSSNTITLSSKPSSNVLGYIYKINLGNKNLTKILGNVNGLTTLTSPDGKLILYSNNNLSLSVYNTDTRDANLLGVRTLPEKCVWGNGSSVIYCAVPKFIDPGLYPDAWYQGEVTFSDQLWKIDIETGNTTMILDPITVAVGEEIDGIKLVLDESENSLFFVNKKDSFLWKLILK